MRVTPESASHDPDYTAVKMVKYSTQAIAIVINHAVQSWILNLDSGPTLVLFDALNEETIWLWVTGGFIHLLGEVVKMHFCCSLAFP